jgi:hypothetical protein
LCFVWSLYCTCHLSHTLSLYREVPGGCVCGTLTHLPPYPPALFHGFVARGCAHVAWHLAGMFLAPALLLAKPNMATACCGNLVHCFFLSSMAAWCAEHHTIRSARSPHCRHAVRRTPCRTCGACVLAFVGMVPCVVIVCRIIWWCCSCFSPACPHTPHNECVPGRPAQLVRFHVKNLRILCPVDSV